MNDVINRMALLFILMAVGYAANKASILDEKGNMIVSKLIMNVTMVATILDSVAGIQIEDKSELVVVFALAAIPFIIFPIISKILIRIMKTPGDKRAAFEAMLIFPNLGFMGVPVISGLYGEEAIFYVSIFMLVFNLVFFSYGLIILSKNTEAGKINFRSMLNPGVVASLFSMVIFFFDIRFPVPIAESLDMLGGATTPLAMIVIGSTIADVSVREVFTEKRIYIFAVIKLIIYPVIVWLLVRNFVENQSLTGIAVILTGMPTAASVVMACNECGSGAKFVSKGIFISTLGSMITIPLLTALIS